CAWLSILGKIPNASDGAAWEKILFEESDADETRSARALSRSFPLDAPRANSGGQTQKFVSRRHDRWRRLSRQWAGSGQCSVGDVFAKGRRFRSADSRSSGAFRVWRTAARPGAHVSRLGERTDARSRRKHSSRPSPRKPTGNDQPSWRDGSGDGRQADGEADEG